MKGKKLILIGLLIFILTFCASGYAFVRILFKPDHVINDTSPGKKYILDIYYHDHGATGASLSCYMTFNEEKNWLTGRARKEKLDYDLCNEMPSVDDPPIKWIDEDTLEIGRFGGPYWYINVPEDID